jgi:hypothetical protein
MYKKIAALLENRSCRFTPSGPTLGEIADLAAGIRDTLLRMGLQTDEPVCICIEDRPRLLAALLAALAGGPPLILPHAFEPRILAEAYAARPFRLILADTDVAPPGGTDVLPVAAPRPHPRWCWCIRLSGPSSGSSRADPPGC